MPVKLIETYVAVCDECGWESSDYFLHGAADLALDDHIMEKH